MQAGKGDGKKRDAARPLQLTMKRGYEVLRDPHLNKVGAGRAGARLGEEGGCPSPRRVPSG